MIGGRDDLRDGDVEKRERVIFFFSFFFLERDFACVSPCFCISAEMEVTAACPGLPQKCIIWPLWCSLDAVGKI